MGMCPKLIVQLTENLPEDFPDDEILIQGEWFDHTFTIPLAEGWLTKVNLSDIARELEKFKDYGPVILLDYA